MQIMFLFMTPKNKKGMIALFPAILISSLLLVILMSVSHTFLAMLSRTTLIDDKSQSLLLARACSRRALSRLVIDHSYTGNETIFIATYPCVVKPVTVVGAVSDQVFGVEVSVVCGETTSIDSLNFNLVTKKTLQERLF